MTNMEQMAQVVQTQQQMLQDITVIKTKQNTDHNRIEENKALATQIHKLAANLEHLTEQLRGQNERVDKLVDSLEARLKSQGERIGDLERTSETRAILLDKYAKRMETLEKHAEETKTKGARKWDAVVEKIILVVIAAVMGAVLYGVGL